MKSTITFLSLLWLCTFACLAQPNASKDKTFAVNYLKQTEADVLNSVKGLSKAQLSFKPDSSTWSIEECIKHIAASEKELWAMVDGALKAPANPELRAKIKGTDSALVKAVEDRSHKAKTFAALEPANSPYKTVPEALAAFKENREKLITFIQSASADNLRNHVSTLPLGTFDAQQLILLIAAHSKRHTSQIKEVIANQAFPKK
ncbi:DinB family protein [Mucilaginibacter roseus]|uniref:DinB family protein n=1 Tax=Mucilaginibacter roseus TaxID=1528868 RepID=A0ABS8U1L5_9SPHI|nr:DinB family protein [Mucilaginibacter roseus]MCD8741011.1 DinB family protein [Mucilaginibacter roseus]